jgi:lipoprotein-anchoring transpeptidase ErfK/SrfK
MKTNYNAYKYIITILFIFGTSYIYADQAQIDRVSRKIFIVQEQRKDLIARYNIEKSRYFNNRTLNSYISKINQLRDREIDLINQKNILISNEINQREIEKQRRLVRKRERVLRAREIRRAKAIEAKKRKKKVKLSRKEINKMDGNIVVNIDISEQKMNVYKGKNLLYTWRVSTAKRGYNTPKGNYKPYHLAKMHYSTLYDNSPMPYSIFFKGGYAIHGTKSTSRLGRRASHGCVRLNTSNAKKLFNLIKHHGYKKTSIKIRA